MLLTNLFQATLFKVLFPHRPVVFPEYDFFSVPSARHLAYDKLDMRWNFPPYPERKQTMNKKYEQTLLKIIEQLRPIDDVFFRAMCHRYLPVPQLLLQIVRGRPDLRLAYCESQSDEIQIGTGRSVVLDIFAIDTDGDVYDLEAERSKSRANPRQLRFHASVLDMGLLQAGDPFTALPDSWTVFFTEHDTMGTGKPITHCQARDEQGVLLNNGQHFIYFNCAYAGNDAYGKLAHDLLCADPDQMHYKVLRDRTRFLKRDRKGKTDMCEALEKLIDETNVEAKMQGKNEKALESASKLLARGVPETIVADCLDLSAAQIQILKQNLVC